MKNLIYVGLGGATGSILRYLVSLLTLRIYPSAGLLAGTLAVNLVGCLLLGFLVGLAESRDLIGAELRLLLMVGLLGGFTTFSTFGYETFDLARGSDRWVSFAYVGVSVIAGVMAAWFGDWLGRAV